MYSSIYDSDLKYCQANVGNYFECQIAMTNAATLAADNAAFYVV